MRNLRISVPVKSYVSVEIETELSNEELESLIKENGGDIWKIPTKLVEIIDHDYEYECEELDSERSTCIYDEDHGLISEFKVNETKWSI